MKTINTLVMKLKSNERIENVYANEEYLFFIHSIKSINNKNIEIETENGFSSDTIDLKVISVDKDKLLIKDREGTEEWYTFIDKDDTSILYLTELKNNAVVYIDSAGHFDVTVKNEDILNKFDVIGITI